MKKLSKDDRATRDRLMADLEIKAAAIEEAWSMVEGAHEQLGLAMSEYNSIVADAVLWRDEMVQQMTDYQSDRSEKWQEGDAGQAYQGWLDEWESADLDAIEIPDLPDQPECPHRDVIDNLPEEPEQ